MAVNLGSNSMSNAYLGNFQVSQMYLGNNLVYPTIPSASFGSGFSGRVLGAEVVMGTSNNFYVFGDLLTYKGTLTTTRIAKMDLIGTADPVFAAAITSSMAVPVWGPNAVYDYLQAPDGKLYVASEAGKFYRLNVDGTRDTTFDIGAGFNTGNVSVILNSDNELVVNIQRTTEGGLTYKGTSVGNLSLLGTDGSLQFAGNEYKSYFDGKDVFVKSIHQLANGGYLLTNVETYRGTTITNKMVKLLPALSIDTSFTSQININPIAGLTRLSTGKFFTQDESNATRRLNDDGSYDSTFTTVTVLSNAIKKVRELSDGKIAIVGNFPSVNGSTTYKQVAILNADGSLNVNFQTRVGFAGGDAIVYDIIENSGYYYIVGSFTSYRGVTANNIIRVNSNGNIA